MRTTLCSGMIKTINVVNMNFYCTTLF